MNTQRHKQSQHKRPQQIQPIKPIKQTRINHQAAEQQSILRKYGKITIHKQQNNITLIHPRQPTATKSTNTHEI